MATLRADSLLLFLLLFFFLTVFCSVGETKIIAEPGQNVILPCKAAENEPVIVLEWRRTDLGGYEHVALYRDDRFDKEGQHLAYINRVALQDREMKDGDVSLVLRNVMINDKGTYECRVVQRENKRMKRSNLKSDPICIINLDVSPPGQKQEQKYQEKNNGADSWSLSWSLYCCFGFIWYYVFSSIKDGNRNKTRLLQKKQNFSKQLQKTIIENFDL